MKGVLCEIAPLLNPQATVMDVCSVKEYPVRLMRELLPESVSILPTAGHRHGRVQTASSYSGSGGE